MPDTGDDKSLSDAVDEIIHLQTSGGLPYYDRDTPNVVHVSFHTNEHDRINIADVGDEPVYTSIDDLEQRLQSVDDRVDRVDRVDLNQQRHLYADQLRHHDLGEPHNCGKSQYGHVDFQWYADGLGFPDLQRTIINVAYFGQSSRPDDAYLDDEFFSDLVIYGLGSYYYAEHGSRKLDGTRYRLSGRVTGRWSSDDGYTSYEEE